MSHFRVLEHTVAGQHIRDRFGAIEPGQEGSLKLAVKQYVPYNNPTPHPGDLTIIGAHANGFPKEMYEPLWEDLLHKMDHCGRKIRGIWIMDVAQQGQSGVLNECILGNDPSWWDHGRDLLFMINQFQSQMPHPIVGVGHSMGGMQLAHLSLMHPRLFQALILIDPVIQRENPSRPYARASTYRRDMWPSREEAALKFKSTGFYQQWDPRVLDKWIEYGLRDLPTDLYPESPSGGQSKVTLTTTKAQELFTFLRPAYRDDKWPECTLHEEMDPDDIEDYPFYRPEPPQVFRHLPDLKPSVLYIFGRTSDLSSEEARRQKLDMTGSGVGGSGGAARDRVKEVVLDCGHLVPMERVGECAEASTSFIDKELVRWQAQLEKLMGHWNKVPRRVRNAIDQNWKHNIGPPPGRSKNSTESKI